MRRLLAAITAVLFAACATVCFTPAAAADPVAGPPFIDHTAWSHWGDLSSLRVYPTAAGRL
ncbi:MAG TPA: DUF2599 domain-containing protein, partial [Candidatus Dormibacteraeota bacterium]|nr:DUF2599 domain-containing protein [Candidatus Dormibacteraeota bacterium]